MKSLLLSYNLLVHYNQRVLIVVTADTSPFGVGATLSHVIDGVEKPVLFASITLTPTQRNYSQLDKEALALLKGVYTYTIEYRKSSQMCPADTLSRLPVADELIKESVQQLVSDKFPLSFVEVAEETKRDKLL
ncbi:hypothetical protein PR048_021799 [Dryococelus australis]|uniref:Reverse transcriptase/retrotransposon-derived protein RNase H-like domain-containing protein n=1 Tax=Dryococelus australis TaxID=614101 RepID=A0ABQ9GZA0_9NEOP|nr:hypothetical protein PR048_021799 [Dryococelus australis]